MPTIEERDPEFRRNPRAVGGTIVRSLVAGRIVIAELLIASGADINAVDEVSKFTPLDYALDGDESMLEFLKSRGARCNTC